MTPSTPITTRREPAAGPAVPQVFQALPLALAVSATLWCAGFALLLLEHIYG